jgi:hypothetical protein
MRDCKHRLSGVIRGWFGIAIRAGAGLMALVVVPPTSASPNLFGEHATVPKTAGSVTGAQATALGRQV